MLYFIDVKTMQTSRQVVIIQISICIAVPTKRRGESLLLSKNRSPSLSNATMTPAIGSTIFTQSTMHPILKESMNRLIDTYQHVEKEKTIL